MPSGGRGKSSSRTIRTARQRNTVLKNKIEMSDVITAAVFTFKGKIQRYFKVVTFELAWLIFNHCTLELGGRGRIAYIHNSSIQQADRG